MNYLRRRDLPSVTDFDRGGKKRGRAKVEDGERERERAQYGGGRRKEKEKYGMRVYRPGASPRTEAGAALWH